MFSIGPDFKRHRSKVDVVPSSEAGTDFSKQNKKGTDFSITEGSRPELVGTAGSM